VTDEEIIGLYLERYGAMLKLGSLEDLLTSEDGFGIKTATPLQRAICRVVDGAPLDDLKDHPHVLRAMGGEVRDIAGTRPREVVICAGIRTFKSILAAMVAIRSPQVIDDSICVRDELPRFSVVSTQMDSAAVIFRHITGCVTGSEALQAIVDGEPTANSVTLTGTVAKQVQVRVVAGARAGRTLVSDWSAGVVFDEAGRMFGSDDGVINLDDGIHAIKGRLLPNAQMLIISSPWAPFGPFYRIVNEGFNKPTPDRVVIRAQAHWLNPVWWTPERRAILKRDDPIAYRTDVLAEFVDAQASMFPHELVESMTLDGVQQIPVSPRHSYIAAMDPATRGNAWTLVVMDRDGDQKRVVLAREWIGKPTQPLSPRAVLTEIHAELDAYGVDEVLTDQHSVDALRDIATDVGLVLIERPWTAARQVQAYGNMEVHALDGRLKIIDHPQVKKDINMVQKKVTQSGWSIALPQTQDGRHCDFAPAVAMACYEFIEEDAQEKALPGTPEYYKQWEQDDIARDIEQQRKQQQKAWYDEPESAGSEHNVDWLGH